MAKKPEYLNLPFKEAIAHLSGKVPMPTEERTKLTAEIHDHAFIVSGLARADLLQSIQWLLGKEQESAQGFDEFLNSFNRLIGRKGWRPSAKRVRTIYDTNIRRSHAAGRYQQMSDPALKERLPLWMWRHRTPPKELGGTPRASHKAQDGKVFRASELEKKKVFCPCAWGCRCTMFAVSEERAKAMGKSISSVPDPKTLVDPGFEHIPGSSPKEERSRIIKEGLANLSPELRKKVEADFRKKGVIK